jgi:gliding motility-associated-like protein
VWTADEETVQFIPSGGSWYMGGTLVATGDSIVVNPTVTTTYTLELEGCGGDIYTADVTIYVESDDASFSYGGITEFCPDEVITPDYIATPGGSFSIDPPDMPINTSTGTIDLSGGTVGTTYTVEYTTPSGPCSNTGILNITIVPYDDASFSYAAPSFCPTGTALPTVTTPGGSFSISPSGMTINASTGQLTLSTGTVGTTYTITYTTADYCPASSTTTVTIDPLDDPAFSYDSASYCPSGFALPTVATTGGSFSITPTSMDIDPVTGELDLSTGIPGTTYYITYTTAAGPCSDYSIESVLINSLDVASFGYAATSYCAGGTISPTFITTPGGTFTVSPPGLDVDSVTGDVDLTTGTVGYTYAITYTTDSGPCSNSGSVSITIDPNDDSTFNYTADEYCMVGTTIPTIVVPGGSFVSSPAGLSINPTNGTIDLAASLAGTYSITYTTPAGFCSSSSSETVTITDFTDAYFEYDTTEYCNEGTAVPFIQNPGGSFIAPAGISMDLVSGELNMAASSPGGPYAILYNSPGCTEQDTFYVTIHPMPVLTMVLDDLVCIEAAPINLVGDPLGGSFSGDAVIGNMFNPGAVDGPGLWPITYTYTSEFNCTSTITDYIEVVQHTVDAGLDQVIIEGTQANLLAEGGVIFSWTPEDYLVCSACPQTPASPGLGEYLYTVTSYDANGCIAFDDVLVTVVPFDDITVYVPNTFTPNGDNINDYLMPMGSDIDYIVSFTVFDRWGAVIWRGENIAPGDQVGGWSGKAENGMILDSGVYAYIIEVGLSFGVNKVVYGNVTLVR